MELTVNGKTDEFEDGITLPELIQQIGAAQEQVAVMINGKVIRRQDIGSSELNNGDVVEILSFAGGG